MLEARNQRFWGYARKEIVGGRPNKNVRRSVGEQLFQRRRPGPLVQFSLETFEKPDSERLMENVHMQVELCEIPLCRRSRPRDGSFRNPGE
jgi:hypothetical protein